MKLEDFDKIKLGQKLYYTIKKEMFDMFNLVQTLECVVVGKIEDLMSVSKTRKLIRITGAPDECYDWDKSCEQFSIERPIPTTKEYQLTRYRHYYIDHREGKLTSTESELYWLKFAESLCKRFGSKGLSHVKTEVLETLTHVVTL